MSRKIMAVLLSLTLLAAMIACSNGGGNNAGQNENASNSGADGGAEAADGPIEVTFGAGIDPNAETIQKLEEKTGETLENNRWTQLFLEKTGVIVKYKLIAQGADYTQKLKLSITADDLPDIFVVGDKADLKQLIEGGAVHEMGELYEQYGSPLLKSIIEAESDRVFDPMRFDGKIYGIPQKMPSTNGYNHLWIREDWLNKLGLERPQTMDDLYNIAVAFAKEDPDGNGQADTFGLGLNKDFINNMRGLFWAYGAYPEFWHLDANGEAVFGTVQPAMKEPLKLLARMYAEGLVDKEFGSKDEAKMQETIVAGKTGMYYGPHWTAYGIQDSVTNDPNAKWVVVPLPTADGSPVQIPLTNATDGTVVVNKKFEHPEKLVQLFNAYVEALFADGADFSHYWTDGDIDSIWTMSPIHTLDPALDIIAHQDIKKALADGTTDQLQGVAQGFYQAMEEGVWGMGMMFGPTDTPFAFVDATYPDQVFWSEYEGAPTPTMATNWSSMNELIGTSFTAMIQGREDVDGGFDKMVDNWNALGGEQIVAEVRAAKAG